MSVTPSMPTINIPSILQSVLVPQFQGIPTAHDVAAYLVSALGNIVRYKLPVRIYVDKDVMSKLSNILVKLGVKFRVVPASEMNGPYIFLGLKGDKLVVRTADEHGNVIYETEVPFGTFIEEFMSLLSKKNILKDITANKTAVYMLEIKSKEVEESLKKAANKVATASAPPEGGEDSGEYGESSVEDELESKLKELEKELMSDWEM